MMDNNMKVNPKIQVLTTEQIESVHDYSIRILENTGIKVESKKAREIFAKTGATKIVDELVFIQRDLVDHAIKTAKSKIDIFNQKGELAFQLFCVFLQS